MTSGGVKEREGVPRGGVAVAAEVDAPDDEEFVEEVACANSRPRMKPKGSNAIACFEAPLSWESGGGVSGDAPSRHCFLGLANTSNTLMSYKGAIGVNDIKRLTMEENICDDGAKSYS